MDSERVKEYKKELQTIFARAVRKGFVEWDRMAALDRGIFDLLDRARNEFSTTEMRWDLFSVANAVFLKLARTEMDDDGDIAMIMADVNDAWEDVYSHLQGEKEEKKVLSFFTKHLDGSIVDFMEDYLYEFMDSHFKTPALLLVKQKFLKEKIQQIEQVGSSTQKEYDISKLQGYLLQILSDMGESIEKVESYAVQLSGGSDVASRMLRIYRERGEQERELSLLKRLMEKRRGWAEYTSYAKRMKDLYLEMGNTTAYRRILKRLFYKNPDDKDLYHEYRHQFTKEEWAPEFSKNLVPAMRKQVKAMPLFAKEKRYDLLMEAAEANDTFAGYERTLKKYYPERCIGILAREADRTMAAARDRQHYRRVVSILKKISSYPGGFSIAEKLAEKYRSAYPNRPALLDELSFL